MNPQFPGVLTFQEATEAIGIHDTTLRAWVHSGRIRPIPQRKVPGYLFTVEECARAKELGVGNTRRRLFR